MKSAQKYFSVILAVMHILTYSTPMHAQVAEEAGMPPIDSISGLDAGVTATDFLPPVIILETMPEDTSTVSEPHEELILPSADPVPAVPTAPLEIVLHDGETYGFGSLYVGADKELFIRIVDLLGNTCPSCHAVMEGSSFINDGLTTIIGILALISPTIINNGEITVQGDLLLSNLGINKEQFFAGVAEFTKDPATNGFIVNTGEIRNLSQGLIALVGGNGGVHNFGTISSNGGAVALVAGDKASFPLTNDGVLNIALDALTGVKGQVFDKNGKLVETKGLVTNSGMLQANGGAVILKAAGAEALYDSIINHTGIIEAKSVSEVNGKIILASETGNIHVKNATIDATGLNDGEKGGSIKILTKGNIIVDGETTVDASGHSGGGEVLIGGDKGVTGPVTAKNIFVGSDVTVKADAIENGNGGKIIVAAREVALAYGDFSARGGAQGGNGGFIETSGKEYLDVNGIGVDASAVNGDAGTWLIDPRNIEVVSSVTNPGGNQQGSFGGGTWTPDGGNNSFASQILASQIKTLLEAGTSVILNTAAAPVSQTGNITVNAAITKALGGNATLTLTTAGAGGIFINAAITATVGLLNVVLTSGASGGISLAANISTNGGNLTMTAGTGGISQTAGTVTANLVSFTSAGAVALAQAGNIWNTITGTTTTGAINIADSGANTTIQDLKTVGSTVTYNHTGAGNVTVTGTVSSGKADPAGTNGGAISITSSNALTIANTATVSSVKGSGGTVTVGGATVNGTVVAGAGNITLNGTGLDAIINSPVISAINYFLSAVRDVIINSTITTSAGSNVTITADSDLNGTGGVWIKQAGGIDSAGTVTLTGSSIFDAGAAGESIRIDADGANNQILAAGDITLQKSGVAPATADINVNGIVKTTGVGKTITVDSADQISSSDNNAAEFISDNLVLKAKNGINVESDVKNASYNNSASGNVAIEDMTGGLTINGATNGGAGSTTITTRSPLTIAVNMIQAGTINLSAGESAATDDNLSINAGVTVQATGAGSDVNLYAGDHVTIAGTVQSNTDQVNVTAGSGDTDNLGNIMIMGLVSAAGNVSLDAIKGAVMNGNSSLIDVTAAFLNVNAGILIHLDTNVTSLAASNLGAGTITIDEIDAVNVVNFFTNGIVTLTANGLVDFTGVGATSVNGMSLLTTTGGINDSGTGTINNSGATTLNATGAGNNITLNNANNFSTVNVVSGKDVTIKDVDSLSFGNATLTGALSLTADSDNNSAGSTLTTGNVNATSISLSGGTDNNDIITMNGTTTATTGNVVVDHAVAANINADVTAATSLTIQNAQIVTLSGNTDLTANNGALRVNTGVNTISLIGAAGTTNVFTEHGDAATTLAPIIASNNANATVNGDGDVTLGNVFLGTGDLTVNVDNNDNGANTGTFNDLTVKNLSISGHNATSGDENFTFNGVTNMSGDLNIGGLGILTYNNDVTAKSITIHDISNRVQLGSNVDLTATNGILSVVTNVANILLAGANGTTNIFDGNGDQAVNLGVITATNPGVNLNIRSEGDINLTSANTQNGALTVDVDNDNDGARTATFGALSSVGGITVSGFGGNDDINFNGAITSGLTIFNSRNVTFASTITTAANIGLFEYNGTGVTTFNGLGTIGGGVSINAGSINFNGAGSLNVAQNAILNATTGNITSGTATSDVIANSLAASSVTGTTLDTNVNGITAINTGAGNVVIREANGANVFDANAANGDVTVTSATGNLAVFNVNASGAATLTATAGAVSDANGSGTNNVTATTLNATAATGISLDTTITTLTNANVTGTGAVVINDLAGGLAVTSATTNNGKITLNAAGGNLDVTTATAGGGNDINLGTTGAGSNVRVNSASAVGGNIVINSSAAIEELGTDIGADLTASDLDLTAVSGIGAAGTIETDAITLLTANVTGTGAINLSDVAGGLAVTSATTNNGAITINATGGNLDATTVTANGASRNVTLSTTTSGNVNVGNVTAAGDNIAITSAGAIEELGSDAAADITSNTMTLTAVSGIGKAARLEINATTLTSASTTAAAGTINLSDTAGGLVVTSATTNNGAITINATSGNLDAVTVTAGGTGRDVNLTTTTSGNIRLGVVRALGDTANVTSAGTINELNNDDAGVQSAEILAGTINLNTNGGDIGQLTSYLDIQPTTLWNVGTNGGDAYIACIGTCPVGQVNLGDGTFYNAGNLTDGNDTLKGEVAGGLWNITAGGVHLDANNTAAGFIGSATNWIEMRLSNYNGVANTNGRMVVTAGTGGIHVSNDVPANNALGLQIGGVSPSTIDGIVSSGNIEVYSFSPLVVAANVAVTLGADIALHSMGNTGNDDLTINSGITVSSTGGNGNILLTAGDRILLDNNAVVSTTGTGTIIAFAGDDYTNGVLDFDGNSDGTIRMNTGSAFRSEDGDITANAVNNVRITEVNADSDNDNTRGDIYIEARDGYISDRNGGAVNLKGDNAVLSANLGIGDAAVADDDEIETNLNTIDLINSISGHANIVEVAAGGALGIIRAFQQGGGNLNIRTLNGDLTVLDTVSLGQGVSATTGRTHLEANGGGANDDLIVRNTVNSTTGKIELYSTSRDVIFSAAGDVTANVGAEIEVNAARDVTMADGTVLNANTGGVQGGIDIDAGRDVTLGSVQTTSTLSVDVNNDAFNAVQIDAGGAVIDGGDTDRDILANNGQTTINAVNGIGHGNSLDVELNSLRATNTIANDIRVREMASGGDLNIVGIDQQAVNGDLNIRTRNGTLTVMTAATLLSGFAGGVAAVDGVTRLFAQDNDASGTDHLIINNTVRSADGMINLDSENDVIASAEGDVTAGDVTRKLGATGAEIEVDAVGNITMADGTIFHANAGGPNGGIDMDAVNGNITLGSVQTSNTSDNAVTIHAENGAIIDGGDIDRDIVVGANGGVILSAQTGIGSRGTGVNVNPNSAANNFATDAIDMTGDGMRLSAFTESGDIQLQNIGALEITTLSDNDGGTPMGSAGAGTVTGVQINDPLALDPNSIIFITAASPMTISSQVTNFDGGNISLYAMGNTAADTMTINANVQSINGNGDLRIVSGGSMTVGAGVNIGTQNDGVTSGTGRVAMGAGFDATGKAADADMSVNPAFAPDVIAGLSAVSLTQTSTNPAGSLLDTAGDTTADLTMAESSSVSTEDGNIIVDAQNNFVVGRVDADGNAGANGITDGTVGNILGFARNGSITDATPGPDFGNNALDFVANALTLLAGGSIGTAADPIEGSAPFMNTFSIGNQFLNMQGDTQVEMNSASGSIFLNATGTILLGHVRASAGEVHLNAGADILSQGGPETRVTASNLIEFIAGGIIGTTNDPIQTQLNATPAQLNISAGGSAPNGISAVVFSNVSNAAVNMLNTPPGLVLFNNLPIAGATLPALIGNQAALYYKPFVRGLRQYGDIDGNYAADFPGFNNYEDLAFSPDISVETSALDIPVRGLTTAPRVVPLPKPAVPTPVQPKVIEQATPVLTQEPTPPAVVPIPGKATPSDESKTNEGVPATPSASN